MTDRRNDSSYFSIRYTEDPARPVVWQEIVRLLARYHVDNPSVLELGPGYCDFINRISAVRKLAVDIDPQAAACAADDVEFIRGDCCDLGMIEPGSLDLVFASNLLEHLDREQAVQVLQSSCSVLKSGGRLILIQPNFRYSYRHYYDDYTHITPFTDKGLSGLVESTGFRIVDCRPRFLPLSMKSGGWVPRYAWLIRLYLRLPFRPLAGQMLLVAEKPNG